MAQHPPPLLQRRSDQSFSVSKFGDCVLLDGKFELYCAKLRAPEGAPEAKVWCKISNTQLHEYQFTHVCFSKDSRQILLHSATTLAVLELPRSVLAEEEIDTERLATTPCPLRILCSLPANEGATITKAAFHALSDYHVVALVGCPVRPRVEVHSLLSGPDSPEGPQTIALHKDQQFVSFCFGNDLDWSALTLYLATKSGAVYFICPLLPEGSVVSIETVDGLQWWAEETRRKPVMTQQWLQAAFAPQALSSQATSAFVRAGSGFRGWQTNVGTARVSCSFRFPPLFHFSSFPLFA